MAIDVSQFVGVFLEESFEGLDLMEAGLIDFRDDDPEAVNAIFRAAHSIKGGAGTFGFREVSDFTHGAETLLDQIRQGERAMTGETADALLAAVDCIRAMLEAARDGSDPDTDRVLETRAVIESLLANAAAAAPVAAARGAPVPGGWHIRFAPHPGMLAGGNDPLRIIAALEPLGPLEVHCEASALPPLAELDAESCALAWDIELNAAVPEQAIREIFEWVEGECELVLSPLPGAPGDDTGANAAPAKRPAQVEATAANGAGPVARAAADTARRNDASSIRVAVEKVDSLVNLVGELVITQSMLSQIGNANDEFDLPRLEQLREGLGQLERQTRELQEGVMGIRMLPISFVFSRFPRVVRDMAAALGKSVELRMEGEETELDKGMIEKLSDPLTHLVRNAIDHGIESTEARRAAGKPEAGQISLKAYHQGGNIVVEVADDGAGLNREKLLAKAASQGLPVSDAMPDREVWALIFAAGFSTADKVTDISGRGVGMDVVRRNIEAVNGRVEIDSRPGAGTRIILRLPLTLAILDGMSVRVGSETYILPLTAILESIQPTSEQLSTVGGKGRVVHLRGEYLPLVALHELFGIEARATRPEDGIVIIAAASDGRAALLVDDLVAQHQVVIKSLETNYRKVPGISGATIMGDGKVAMILDVDMLLRLRRTH
ncbi:chemotaxis protein CheA [Thioalkalivibrio sp. XN279]|uniref:chemotaxis protein CheA n=1 Tax=Thioalkalivibrio sp. XN279 TaxID=2714953 RepID=UPI001407563D|nr:chemotaxis protein CheA [Thioalkalivibrio sp. XN279]NHA13394.1 chemotaxis protein CheA [Thioalkalivibrio sp. XN279]